MQTGPHVNWFIPETVFILVLLRILLLSMALKSLWRMVLHAKKKKKPHQKEATCHIARLPPEILLEITNFLPSRSALCLALTCKYFLNVLDSTGDLRRSNEFQHPREEPLTSQTVLRKYVFESERWKLLCQLENPKWYCCTACQKLHPASEFAEEALSVRAEKRTCIFGPFVGIVHLCPCIKMTFRDKLKLVASMKQAKEYHTSGLELDIDKNARLWHECRYDYNDSDYGLITVKMEINPSLDEAGNLVVTSTYFLHGPPLYSAARSTRRLCCPHRTLLYFIFDLRNFLHMGSDRYRRPLPCRWCQTTFQVLELHPAIASCVFTTKRNLGSGTYHADEVWYNQTDLAYETLDLDGLLQRSPRKLWADTVWREP